MLRHASLHVLKAAAVSIPLVREVERHFPDGRPGVGFIRRTIEAFTGTAEQHTGGLDGFMTDAVAHLHRNLPSASLTNKETRRVQDFLTCLTDRAAMAPGATGTPVATLEKALPLLLPELGEAFEFACALAADLLSDENLVLPDITRSTGFDAQVGASCRVDDRTSGLQNEVTLLLPARGFDKASLYAAPYLLAHELICHASQGVCGPGAREGSGSGCAWSDGWMDCLAYEEICDRLQGEAIDQEWIDEARAGVAARAEAAHSARYRDPCLSKSSEADQSARIEAKQAFIALKLSAMAQGRSETESEAFRRAFSLRYNALNLTYDDRQPLVVGLFVKLQDPESAGPAIKAIEAFLAAPNPAALHRAFAF